jgi:hypothetical protein
MMARAVETAGSTQGFVSRRVAGDLQRFREFVEERGRETGARRGHVERHTVGKSPRVR